MLSSVHFLVMYTHSITTYQPAILKPKQLNYGLDIEAYCSACFNKKTLLQITLINHVYTGRCACKQYAYTILMQRVQRL